MRRPVSARITLGRAIGELLVAAHRNGLQLDGRRILTLLFLADSAQGVDGGDGERAESGAVWQDDEWGPYDPCAIEALEVLVSTGKAQVTAAESDRSCRDHDVIVATEALLAAPEPTLDPAFARTLQQTVAQFGALPTEELRAIATTRGTMYFSPERQRQRRVEAARRPATSKLSKEAAAAFPRTRLVRDTMSQLTSGLTLADYFDHAQRKGEARGAESRDVEAREDA